jgi:hypothetical protein
MTDAQKMTDGIDGRLPVGESSAQPAQGGSMKTLVPLAIAVAWSGLQFGTLWIMFTSIVPLLNSRGPQEYLDTCQGIDMHFFHPIAFWGGVLMMVNGVYLATQVDGAAKVTVALAALCMLGVGMVSETQNRPLWRKLERWTVPELPGNWPQLRQHWGNMHALRTAFAFSGLVLFTTTMIIQYQP